VWGRGTAHRPSGTTPEERKREAQCRIFSVDDPGWPAWRGLQGHQLFRKGMAPISRKFSRQKSAIRKEGLVKKGTAISGEQEGKSRKNVSVVEKELDHILRKGKGHVGERV